MVLRCFIFFDLTFVYTFCSFDCISHSPREKNFELIPQWQIRIDPDLQCRDATALSLVDQLSQYDKNYLSFLAGADLCKRLSGTHSKCHALSFDLSLPCSSREPYMPNRSTMHQNPPILSGHMAQSTSSHRHLRHHLHQLLHIQFLLAKHSTLLTHITLSTNTTSAHRALHPFHHLSLVHLTLHKRPHQEATQHWMPPAPMALISILTGKRTKTTMTTRRSTA